MFADSRSALRTVAMAAAAALLFGSTAAAQAAPAAATAAAATLKVGDMAPDFTVTTVTMNGVSSKPFKLSEHRGETIVLAFFPRARTKGCTTQMEAYRDQYAGVFQGGKKVTLVGVSTDADTTLVAWAREAKFPFTFATDMDSRVGAAFGASTARNAHNRYLFVIDPSGKIAYAATPFLQLSADAYTELGAAISHASAGH